MRFLQYIPTALLLGYAATAERSAVVPLTGVSFDQVVNAQPVMLVAFLLSKSVDCEALAPEYEKAATVLGDSMGIALATVDCIDQEDLCAKYHVEDFSDRITDGIAGNTGSRKCASLVVLRHGTSIASYEGPLKGDRIFSFMLMLPVPTVIEVTATNHNAVKTSADVVFIAYMSSPTESSASAFSAVAERQHGDGLVFGLCTDEAAIASAGVTPPAVVAYRKSDSAPRAAFTTGASTARELRRFVSQHSLPLVGDVASIGYLRYRRTGLPLAFLFIERADPVLHAHYIAALRRVAEKYWGRLAFGYTSSRVYAKAFGLSDDGPWPVLAIQGRNGALQATAQGPYVSTDILTKFVDRFLAREPAAPASQHTNVYEVVGSEFAKVVFDDEKDVFLEVYTTHGCPHCKRLKPTWDLLGDKYAALSDRITIARVEATSNDLPFSVTAVPLLRFKKAGTREFIDFEGERSLELLVEFVETHAANPLSSELAESSAEDAQHEFHSPES